MCYIRLQFHHRIAEFTGVPVDEVAVTVGFAVEFSAAKAGIHSYCAVRTRDAKVVE